MSLLPRATLHSDSKQVYRADPLDLVTVPSKVGLSVYSGMICYYLFLQQEISESRLNG